MLKQVLIDIQRRLSEADTGLACIAEDWGQLDYYEGMPPVSFPCALVDGESANYSDCSAGVQQGEATAVIRVADLRLTTANALFEDSEEAFSIFDILQKVYLALQNRDGEGYGRMTRVSTKRIRREDAIREFQITFSYGFRDSSATAARRRVEAAAPEIVVTKQKSPRIAEA